MEKDQNLNLEAWASGEGISFKSKEAEEDYKERAGRIAKAIRLETPDRVPVVPVTNFFPASYAGMTAEEVMYDSEKLGNAFEEFVSEFEPDGSTVSQMLIPPGKIFEILDCNYYRWPGHGSSPDTTYQCVEGEYMKTGEYDELIQDPTDFWLRKALPRFFGELEPFENLSSPIYTMEFPVSFFTVLSFGSPDVQSGLNALMEAGGEALRWQESVGGVVQEITGAGYPPLVGGFTKAPYDVIGDTLRGSRGVMLDMKRRPDKLLEAMERITPLMVKIGAAAKATGIPIVFIPLHKGADGFMSDEEFRKFYWPYLKRVMEGLIDEGLIPFLYVEGAYNQRLEVIKDHPEGNALWCFDQTDMHDAKEALGGKACIAGNVSSSLLEIGEPEEVEKYCKNLIDKVGEDGFILSSGAVVDDAKPENMHAMMDSVKE